MRSLYHFLTLFTSISTLLCCALPALLVTIGMGAALAGFLTQYPELIWLSENKLWLFIIGGILLLLGGIVQFKNKDEVCPINIEQKEACSRSRRISKIVYIISIVIYLVGFSFAYLIPYFM